MTGTESNKSSWLSMQTINLWLLPGLMLVALSLLFRFSSLDLTISSLFYDDLNATWPRFNDQPWLFLFEYGVFLPLVVGIGGACVAVLGLVRLIDERKSRMGLFLALTILIGPGLIINGILKPTWGRPRPSDCVEFGGKANFEPLGFNGGPSLGRSFPSGHASMGFFLAIPALLCLHRRKNLGLAILLLGLSYGFAMGIGRIVQGRHFPSDVLWSLAITYFSGLTLLYLLRLHSPLRSTGSIEGEVQKSRETESQGRRVIPFRKNREELDTIASVALSKSARRAA